jgi:hypothetical protein
MYSHLLRWRKLFIMLRYFIGLLLTIGLIIVLILLLFGGGKSKAPVAPRTLDSYAFTNAEVQMIIDGPINAVQNHQEVQVTVDQYNTVYEQLQGYDGDVVNQQTFPNTQSGYAVFLHALTVAGFTKGNSNPDMSDERGYCPLGDRYIFELVQNGSDIDRFWATSCGSPKTYDGNVNLTLELFEAQVPGYQTLTQGIQF